MTRAMIVMVLGLALSGLGQAAEENKASAFDGFRKKIELLTPKKKLQTTTAVGGVRGAQAHADELYWKGEQPEQTIDATELAAFAEALTFAEAGDKAQAEKGLKEFLRNYPQSQLKSDAEQALALLKEEAAKP